MGKFVSIDICYPCSAYIYHFMYGDIDYMPNCVKSAKTGTGTRPSLARNVGTF